MYQARRPDEEKPAVRWLPFQPNPDLPAEGIPRQEHLERKFGPGHAHSYARVAGVGERAGLDRAALAAYLASEGGRESVLQADREARRAGINGVPFFMFNRRTAVSGAQAPDTLLQAMREARPLEAEGQR